jgi:hypothetical protein
MSNTFDNSQAAINTVVASHREWLAGPGESVRQRALRKIQEHLEIGEIRKAGPIATALQSLGMYYGVVSGLRLQDSTDEGLSEADRAVAYWIWSIRLEHLSSRRIGGPFNLPKLVSVAANGLCYAMANAMDHWAGLVSEVLIDASSSSRAVANGYWLDRRFEQFALSLYRGNWRQTDRSSLQKGPYGELVRRWDDDKEFASSLNAVCDYHCEAMQDDGEGRYPEFDHPPFDLIPWEVLLILRIREREGMAMPSLEHPLIARFRDRSMEPRRAFEDDLLDEVCVFVFQHS